MIEHFYEYLPAAWFTEGRYYVLLSVLLLMALSFLLGWWARGRAKERPET